MSGSKIPFFIFSGALLLQSFAFANSQTSLKEFLLNLQRDPSAAIRALPPKFDSAGNPWQTHQPPISIEAKNAFRKKLCPGSLVGDSCQKNSFLDFILQPQAQIDADSQVELFFRNTAYVAQIEELSADNLTSSASETTPWSGDYWPTYRGGIAARFQDPHYPSGANFKDYDKYFKNHEKIDFSKANELKNLSPAEKYDVLMGLSHMPLRSSVIEDARDTYRANGNKIETWFGICHGWAPASFMCKRPRHSVVVPTLTKDVKIEFTPDDLKALASHLWAQTTIESNILGGRCDDKEPAVDEFGRLTSTKCFDVNPGSWHIAMINQMGLQHRALVIDASYDYEVWNQPVSSYQVKFFNPETKSEVTRFNEAMVRREQFNSDLFKSRRSPNAIFILGVAMDVTYILETEADGRDTDEENLDLKKTVKYIYDLEIDASGKIIGGEWYQRTHPDFIWSPSVNARPVSVTEHQLKETWSGQASPPASWVPSAEMAARYSQPLAGVIEKLLDLAQ